MTRVTTREVRFLNGKFGSNPMLSKDTYRGIEMGRRDDPKYKERVGRYLLNAPIA